MKGRTKLINRKITVFSVMLRRIYVDLACCCEAFTEFFTAKDLTYNLFSLVYVLYFFIIFPINAVISIFRFFLDLVNPNFDARKEYFELHPYCMTHGGKLSMNYSVFCNYGYDKSYEKAQKEIRKVIMSNNGVLHGVLLEDKNLPNSLTELMCKDASGISDNRLYYASFGNEINKALFSLFNDFLILKKEGNVIYLAFDKAKESLLENKLSTLFRTNIKIMLT